MLQRGSATGLNQAKSRSSFSRWRLPRTIACSGNATLSAKGGRHKAVAAAEALAMGLVNRSAPAAELEALVNDVAAGIAANAPLTVSSIKLSVGEAMKSVNRGFIIGSVISVVGFIVLYLGSVVLALVEQPRSLLRRVLRMAPPAVPVAASLEPTTVSPVADRSVWSVPPSDKPAYPKAGGSPGLWFDGWEPQGRNRG